MKLLKCIKCGWIHFGVSRKYIIEWRRSWKHQYSIKTPEDLKCYGLTHSKLPSIKDSYLQCFKCRCAYSNMKPATKSIIGSTINPIFDPSIKD